MTVKLAEPRTRRGWPSWAKAQFELIESERIPGMQEAGTTATTH